jgi:CheY-like chemotaxis protein
MAKKILIVDDQHYIVELLSDVLRDSGYLVQGCSDPRRALQLLGSFQPDGLILDLIMPDIDGLTLLQTIRQNKETENLPIIVCTAAVLNGDERSLFRDMGISILAKPFDIDKFVPIVERLIGPS